VQRRCSDDAAVAPQLSRRSCHAAAAVTRLQLSRRCSYRATAGAGPKSCGAVSAALARSHARVWRTQVRLHVRMEPGGPKEMDTIKILEWIDRALVHESTLVGQPRCDGSIRTAGCWHDRPAAWTFFRSQTAWVPLCSPAWASLELSRIQTSAHFNFDLPICN
jgi:hypothetical protein